VSLVNSKNIYIKRNLG